MAKIHLDRLRRKYGYTGENLQALMDPIIANNSENISRRIGEVSQANWNKALKKISTKEKQFIAPDFSDVLPKRSVFIRKAAESGTKLKDSLRDSLTKNLRDTLSQFTPKTKEATFIRRRGQLAGTINRNLITEFQEKITKTFETYTKKDPKLGVPKNVHAIAVTEMRSSISEMKNSYNEKLVNDNPDVVMIKQWIQNRNLAKEPRRGHRKVDKKKVPIDQAFSVPLIRKIQGRWVEMGITLMMFPHDPTAPAEQVIGCLPGESLVSARDVKNIIRRKYHGDLITIKTHEGLSVTVTPNHPILTENGWILAGAIKVGTNIVSVSPSEEFFFLNPNKYNRPTPIRKIFNFISVVFFEKWITGIDPNLNGNLSDGNVNIKLVGSKLWNTFVSLRYKPIHYFLFSISNMAKIFLVSLGSLYKSFVRLLASACHFVRIPCKNFSALGRKFVHSNFSGGRGSAPNNIIFQEPLSNGAPVDFKDFCKSKLGSSFSVQLDKVVDINNNSFHGFVYNLHTVDNFFLSQTKPLYRNSIKKSIILHNCNCDVKYLAKRKKQLT